MHHQTTVLAGLLKFIPWTVFDRLVAQHGTDARSRTLSSRHHLVAMLYAQLAASHSLRDLTASLESHKARLYHAGAKPVQRTTLADANSKRSPEVFSGLFAALVGQMHRGLRRTLGESIYLIDSTSVRLSSLSADWAQFSSRVCGVKMHIVYDAQAETPVYASVTPSRVNDITAAHEMPVVPGATYVFDLGYYDYAWWARMDAAGCHIVTRFKTNTPLRITATMDVPEGSTIVSDRIGLLPQRQAARRTNPFSDPVREVVIRLDTGKTLRILSNDLDLPAQDIADLYKKRWAIELFFRWIKQTLKIRQFLGRSENAIRIQIATALIAYLLLRMAQATQKTTQSPLHYARLVRTNLMHRKGLGDLIHPPNPTPHDPRQLQISLQ